MNYAFARIMETILWAISASEANNQVQSRGLSKGQTHSRISTLMNLINHETHVLKGDSVWSGPSVLPDRGDAASFDGIQPQAALVFRFIGPRISRTRRHSDACVSGFWRYAAGPSPSACRVTSMSE